MTDSVSEKRMKLFVVGEHSPRPSEWRNNHVLVLAENEDQAIKMAEEGFTVSEVKMDEAAMLL
jgi:hypothetical protein